MLWKIAARLSRNLVPEYAKNIAMMMDSGSEAGEGGITYIL